MIYGSVCSGIEAATVAWEPLGWKPAFFSEIASFPRSVLEYRFKAKCVSKTRAPNEIPMFGDFTMIRPNIMRRLGIEPIDLLVGGTPCQSFSIAGLRGGLDDDRGNLALEFLKLARRTRARWLLWENVPGALSANGGRDFGSILGGLVELGYGFAYRVLDAQNFGVPQRRRRVFLVGYCGGWQYPAAVLFERESLLRNSPPCLTSEQKIAAANGPCLASGKPVTGTLMKNAETKQWLGNQEAFSGDYHVVHGTQYPITSDIAHTLGRNNGQENALVYADPTNEFRIRKFMPIETDRLQGFEGDFTKVPYQGKPANECPDGPRYGATGNSMAVPVMNWIGQRIQAVDDIIKHQGPTA